MKYRVVRPDGTVIEARPGINMEFALWEAREHDERLHRIIQRNRTNNVQSARRAKYDFVEVASDRQ